MAEEKCCPYKKTDYQVPSKQMCNREKCQFWIPKAYGDENDTGECSEVMKSHYLFQILETLELFLKQGVGK
jgi:hypothetical protein